MKVHLAALSALVLVGCATSAPPVSPVRDGSPSAHADGGTPTDAAADLDGVDLAVGDLSAVADLARPVDLRGRDLAPPPDLSAPRDLKPPPDLMTPPDLAPICPRPSGSPCGIDPQCGCMSMQACTIIDYTGGGTTCQASGTVPDYSICTGTGAGQCKAGSACVDGVCQPYCKNASECPGAYRGCDQVQASGTDVPGFLVCSQRCDPLNPTSTTAPYAGCGPQVSCLPSPSGETNCVAPTDSSGTEDQPCGDSLLNPKNPVQSDCAPGYACVNVSPIPGFNVFSCEKFCHVGSNTDCVSLNSDAGTYSCSSLSPKQLAGAVEIGICTAN